MPDLTHASATVLAAFLASLVEFVEALTIVLAVGTVRGWRPALSGAAGGGLLLALLVALFGPLLGQVPIAWLQMVVGVLLLLFGMRWLRKAVLRGAGLIPLHDEASAYRKETHLLQEAAPPPGPWDPVALITSFKAVLLEGLEVVFIVIALGAAGTRLLPASVGALAALLVVVALGVAVHRPLTRVPENALKFAVGVLLSAFGVFWIGEALGLAWPGGDLAILWLALGDAVAARLAMAGAAVLVRQTADAKLAPAEGRVP